MGPQFNPDAMSEEEKINFLAEMFTNFSQMGGQPPYGSGHFGGAANPAQSTYDVFPFAPWEFFRAMSGFYPWGIMNRMCGFGPMNRSPWNTGVGFYAPPWRR